MKKKFVLLFLLIATIGTAQNGISYQAVLLNPNGEQLPGADNSKIPLVNSSICLRFSIVASSGGTPEYQETITTRTDAFGMVNVTIGTGNPTPGSPSFNTISWGSGPKNLKVELDLTGLCTSFITVSDQPFTSVPFALYALNSGSGGGSSTTTLTGDVSGTGTGTVATSIANNVITSTKILDGEISNIDINSSAAIDFTKLNIQKSNILGLGIVKADFGLGNVDNTSDANKPISTATQTALNAKENTISEGTTSQYWRGDKTWQTLDNAVVGLGNVDNTSDANKPISTATQTALNAKENTISAGTTSQYWRGDKTWQTLDNTVVGLGNVDNTSDANKPISTATQTALNAKENTISAGTTSQYWRGDKTWQTLDSTVVGLGNVDNTSDLDKPISTATQTLISTIIADIATNTTNIATNTTAITTNTSNITANTTAIATNTTDIAANTTAIATNTTDIAANSTAIATNTSNITANTTAIATNTTDIAANSTAIATNTTDIAANTTAIATNTTNITANTTAIATNTTDIAANSTAIATNTSNIAANTTAIATNTTNIATNTTAIATNTTNIATNTTAIATNTTDIATNTTAIATNTSNIAANTTAIATNTTNIAANTTAIATNTTDIAANSTAIATNTSNIAANTTAIATNTTNIATNTTAIATNTTNIATNTTAIATNTSNIAANTTAIATNTTNIAANTTAIATNTTNIATNTTAIATNTTNIAANSTAIATNTTNIATNTTAIATNTTDIAANSTAIATNTTNIAANSTAIATNTTNIATKAPLLSPNLVTPDIHIATGTSLTLSSNATVGGILEVKKIVDSNSVIDTSGIDNITINSISGRFKIPNLFTDPYTITINNTYVNPDSIILCTMTNNNIGNDYYIQSVDAGLNLFKVTLSTLMAASQNISINFLVIN